MSAEIYVHPAVVREPDLFRQIQQTIGRRAVWSHRGAHAELVEDWWKATSPAVDYVGSPDNGPEAA